MPKRGKSVHVARTHRKHKNKVYETVLLRHTFREDGKVKHQTLGNLSHLPENAIKAIEDTLAGKTLLPLGEAVTVTGTLPHGHVHALLEAAKRLKLPQSISSTPSRERSIIVGLVIQRLLRPASKLSSCQLWKNTTLAEELDLQDVTVDELDAAMDWLLPRQKRIEKKLAKRHLKPGSPMLYDLSSSSVEGRKCPLAAFGHSRDGKPGRLQRTYGVMTDSDGRPISVQAYSGNTSDSATIKEAVETLRKDFGQREICLVGDRVMLPGTKIEVLREIPDMSWVTALRSTSIKCLVEEKYIQTSLFDERNIAEISNKDYPGERLIVCRNPLLLDERRRKRVALLDAAEKKLETIAKMVDGGRLKDPLKIEEKVGTALKGGKMRKHFILTVAEGALLFERNITSIEREEALDGLYVLRTNLPAEEASTEEVARRYKGLQKVERAFRSLKLSGLEVRPLYHYAEERVRAHLFVCLLAYYVEWHLRQAWEPLMHTAPPPETSDSVATKPKQAPKRVTAEGWPARSFRGLLEALGARSRCWMRVAGSAQEISQDAVMSPLQRRAWELVREMEPV